MELNVVYMLIAVSCFTLLLSIIVSRNFLFSIPLMLFSTVVTYEISQLFVDGEITSTQSFITTANTVITNSTVVQSNVLQGIFEFLAIFEFVFFVFLVIMAIKEINPLGEED